MEHISDVKKPMHTFGMNPSITFFCFRFPEFSLTLELRRTPKLYELAVSLLFAGFFINWKRKMFP